ncbi:MAG: Trk family potassium uptake protein [Planctomycetes bacterium]|nr:Trk family potassium uptake protein [Planctomycetota bacterium]
MQLHYKNNRLERILIGVNALTAAVVTASFVVLFGFDEPLLPKQEQILYAVQVALLCVFIVEKIIRLFNVVSKAEFWGANWFEVPLLFGLLVAVFGAGRWFALGQAETSAVRHLAVGIYLLTQVVTKLCRTCVNLAASGKNPTRTLIASFLFLIISGAGLLMLPRAANEGKESLRLVDALFTATSATCVTGLIVKDTGRDFSLMGQVVILGLIQLGGLGIVVFGAVIALLLGQALSVRESVAMQDLLSARTLSRIGNMIAFIFVGTVLIEAVGAVSLLGMWGDANVHERWFCSIFHSISAFCNAGFSLFSDSFVSYNRSWGVYVVVCPLIILGGLGFSVLYDLGNILANRVRRFFKRRLNKQYRFSMEAPKRMRLQTKIVLSVSAGLIVLGAAAILLFERYAKGDGSVQEPDVFGALFQSITARTAGFNTVDISAMSASSRLVLILFMFIGGSPGSTAGGIKTVTLAVVIMTVVAALRKRSEVEMFRRSVRIVVVGRAITVTLLFVAVLFAATLALSISENSNGFTMSDIMFEAGSALGTVGLTTGITPELTDAGKLIIIAAMLIGRLGPLTLLAALTFNLTPVRYNYPDEAIIVG